MPRLFALTGALFGATGVALGAFGAHALRAQLSPRLLETWQTAVSYQLLHAVMLLIVFILIRHSAAQHQHTERLLYWAGIAFLVGVLLFSGSLYALCLGGGSVFGPLTPLGGVSLIIGWLALTLALWRQTRD